MIYYILAAGEGSRLKDEGISVPKALVPIENKPMIGRLIGQMMACGADSIVVIANANEGMLIDFLKALKHEIDTPLHVLPATTPSSLHSFYKMSSCISGEKFIMTTVDTIFQTEDFRRYVQSFNASDADAFMAVTKYIDDEKPLYVDVDDSMDIVDFCDSDTKGFSFFSGGIYGLTHKTIAIAKQCIDSGISRMRNFQRALIAAGLKVKAWDFGKILDVDHAGDIAKAEEFLSDDK